MDGDMRCFSYKGIDCCICPTTDELGELYMKKYDVVICDMNYEAKDNIASARLYLAFQGIGNFYINGQEVAPDEWFKQGSMEYRDEIGYNV